LAPIGCKKTNSCLDRRVELAIFKIDRRRAGKGLPADQQALLFLASKVELHPTAGAAMDDTPTGYG